MSELMSMPSNDLYQSSASSNADDSKDIILKNIQLELDRHRMREVLEIFKSSVNNEVRKNGSYIIWDLVPIICQRLRGLNEFRFKTFNCCRQILLDLCEICNPKELLIIYLSELENDLNIARHSKRDQNSVNEEDCAEEEESVDEFEITDSNCFRALLKPFERILIKLPKKRNETLKSVLSSLNEHVSRLPLNSIETFDFETNDRNTLMLNSAVKNLNTALSMYVDFLGTFVNEVDITNLNPNYQICCKTSDPNIQRMVLLKSLIRILHYPLIFMDLTDPSLNTSQPPPTASAEVNNCNQIKPNIFDEEYVTSRVVAIKVIKLISCLHSNFYTLLNRTDLITSEECITTNSEFSDIYLSSDIFRSAMSVVGYLLATDPELSPSNFMPRVYTHIYNFGVHLPYLRYLLENNQFLVYDKGLVLLASLLEHIKEETLEAKFIDLFRQIPIEKSLVSIIIFSSVRSCRDRALVLFKKLLYCFDSVGRYKILYSILSQPRQHSGFQGIIIGLYKDLLFTNPIYQKSNLHRLVRSIIGISLPEEVSSDLLEKNDLIFSAISFFRYILLRDPKNENTTRIWDIIVVIRENFLNTLYKALDLSRAHYKLELCKLKEIKVNKKSKRKSKQSNVVDLKVIESNCQVPVPEMTIEQEHQILLLALQNFDLLESVLIRLKEIVDEQ